MKTTTREHLTRTLDTRLEAMAAKRIEELHQKMLRAAVLAPATLTPHLNEVATFDLVALAKRNGLKAGSTGRRNVYLTTLASHYRNAAR